MSLLQPSNYGCAVCIAALLVHVRCASCLGLLRSSPPQVPLTACHSAICTRGSGAPQDESCGNCQGSPP
eukprot:4070449-Alexandrium_andersonii.AAC.1